MSSPGMKDFVSCLEKEELFEFADNYNIPSTQSRKAIISQILRNFSGKSQLFFHEYIGFCRTKIESFYVLRGGFKNRAF